MGDYHTIERIGDHLGLRNKRSYQLQLEAHQKDGGAGYKESKADKVAAIKS